MSAAARRPEPVVVPDHVTSNIEAVAALRVTSEGRLRPTQRWIEALTASLGRPRTLAALLAAIAGWISYNAAVAPLVGARVLDPAPFFWLQGVVGVCGVLMGTMILTTQNRQSQDTEQRAHLELQVSLLAEQRTAKIIALIEELRRDLPTVKDRHDPVAEAMQETVAPGAVISALEATLNRPAPLPDERGAVEKTNK